MAEPSVAPLPPMRALPYADRPPQSRRRQDVSSPTSHPRTDVALAAAAKKPIDRAHAARSIPKSAVDRTLAALGLLVLLPLLLALAFAVRVQSRGPAFYRQERVGLGGRPFRI